MAVSVKRVRDVFTAEDFQEKVCKFREPVVLCGLDLGCAPELWNPQYLREKCGDCPVKIHVCSHRQMNFINKNFTYKLILE